MSLFEIHCHTKEVSICGWVNGKEVANIHKKAGFDGICITDHYYKGFFEMHPGKSDREIVDQYLAGYRSAKKQGDLIGLTVLLGIELRFEENINDYLVYGIDEQFLYDNPHVYEMTLSRFVESIKGTDILLVFAHPFREVITMMDPALFEAVESYNGAFRLNSRNHLANQFQKMHNLIGTCGSDFHRVEDIALASMEFYDDISNVKQMINAIRDNRFSHKIKVQE
ncbi:MAG: PHP domain-containing protein [Clostridia bacterium]|nr:PHP domain-containing protein [Clostridia bacterium]